MREGVRAGQFSAPESILSRVALRLFFACACSFPRVMRSVGSGLTWAAILASGCTRRNVGANLERIRGKSTGSWQRLRFAQTVLHSFYDFVLDLAILRDKDPDEIRRLVAEIRGEENYLAGRQAGKGAVIVTGHLGSFEVGLAALSKVEPVVHVVFKRDRFSAFEKLRSEFRRRMGIREAAIDDGWKSLMQMRDALSRNEVVVMQGDRAYPDQRWMKVAVGAGNLQLPVGPITLARIVGSPVVPIFTTRSNNGHTRDGNGSGKRGSRERFLVHILEPIYVADDDDAVAMSKVGRAIESMLREYPEQWLVLDRAFVEDEE